MRALSIHLRDPEDHGRLGFHADCPICRRERLVGVLLSEPIVSRRTQALVATGVLALSAAAPSAVLAAEPDQEHEGSTAPEQILPADPSESPNFDPGGESTDLPFEDQSAGPAQPSPGPSDDENAAPEQEPSVDPAAPIVDAGDEATAPASPEQAPPADSGPVSAPSGQTAAPSEPAPNATAPQPQADATPTPTKAPPERVRKPKPRRVAIHKPELNRPSPLAPSADSASPVVQPPPIQPKAAGAGDHARPGDRSHVVLTGESLWSIADDLLGGDASAARVAREVHALWQLNKERIGTGDPDLLMVGTSLRLR